MAHNTRTQPDATWNNGGAEGYVVPKTDFQDLDRKLFSAVNGDQGGTWAPSSAIAIGDVGNPASPSATITGPVVIGSGGSITTRSGSRFYYDDAAYPALGPNHPGRARSILTSTLQRKSTQPYHWITTPANMSIQSVGLTVQAAKAKVVPHNGYGSVSGLITGIFVADDIVPEKSFLEQPSFVLPLRVHDGARFVRATLKFRVPNRRTAVPVAMPRVRIVRVDASGNIAPLKSTADGLGFISPPIPATPDAWMNGGLVQSLVYACDQNNVIDTSQYYYELHLIEEVGLTETINVWSCDGVVSLERKLDVACVATSNIALTGNATIDNVPTVIGTRVLLTAQTLPDENGIWLANFNAGAWQRAADCDQAQDFTPNFIVEVAGGTVYKNTLWQLESPTSNQQVLLTTAGGGSGIGTPIAFRRRKPHGNVYHSVLCDFDQILDMRPQ